MNRLSSATGLLVLGGLLVWGTTASAQTRTESLRWLHADPTNTSGYNVYFGTSSRGYTQKLNVGVPPIVATAYSTDVQVPATGSVYFAVTAFDDQGNESPFSNEIVRTASGGGGTSPPPPPPPTGAQSAISGFVLRDGRTASVLDGAFTTGDQIDAAVQSCTMIEIVGNSYLSQSGPGSVRYVFDGQSTACNDPGISHENTAPYFWERQNACAPTLAQVGSHQLTAIPYDGDDCSGEAGTPVTVDFMVIDSSGGGSGTALGQPGRPLLIQ